MRARHARISINSSDFATRGDPLLQFHFSVVSLPRSMVARPAQQKT
jgi:hypothetical protein